MCASKVCGSLLFPHSVKAPFPSSISLPPLKHLMPVWLKYSMVPGLRLWLTYWRCYLLSPVTETITWSSVRERCSSSIIASGLIQHGLICFSRLVCPIHPNIIFRQNQGNECTNLVEYMARSWSFCIYPCILFKTAVTMYFSEAHRQIKSCGSNRFYTLKHDQRA